MASIFPLPEKYDGLVYQIRPAWAKVNADALYIVKEPLTKFAK
jgi:hypothetical protein